MALMFSGVSTEARPPPAPPALAFGAGVPFAGPPPPPPLLARPPSRFPAIGSRLVMRGINAAHDIGALKGVSSKANDRLLLLVCTEVIIERFSGNLIAAR